jgi:iduronate 2-sulfatase
LRRRLAAARPDRAATCLFIASDDLNHALGCYGHPLVKSPNIDELAATGVRFDRAYCQFPFCGPSRASLLTGLRPDTVGVTTNERVDFRERRPDAVTLPQMFRNQGSKSMRAGKIFHMGVPGGVGTPTYQDPPSWDISVSPPGLEGKSPGLSGDPTPGLRDGLRMQWIRTVDDSGQADTAATDLAIEWLAESRDQPFFLGLGLVRPHVPFVAPGELFDMYPLDDIEPVRNPPDDIDDIPAAAKELRPFLWNNMGMSATDQRLALRGYYASVSYMDRQVGRALQALERNGLADNTVVVFFSDHGWHLGEHTHWQKMSLMEESVRAPLIIRAPGALGNGRSTRALVELVDLFPTLAELCGLEPPPGLEGVSLRPILEDPSASVKDAAFSQIEYENRIHGRTVRTDRYRYIEWRGDGAGEELYDHRSDPREFTNLAAHPEHVAVVQRLRGMLAPAWAAAEA